MPIDRKTRVFSKGGQLKVGIIGCGYVGPAPGVALRRSGAQSHGIRYRSPQGGHAQCRQVLHRAHPSEQDPAVSSTASTSGATNDFEKLKEADAILICVPTPLDERRRARSELRRAEPPSLFIPNCKRDSWWSSNRPLTRGTTEELVLPILEKSGLRCPIAVGPEHENIAADFFPGLFGRNARIPETSSLAWRRFPKVVGGLNPPSGPRAAQALYAAGRGSRSFRSAPRRARGDGQAAREKHLPLREHRAG